MMIKNIILAAIAAMSIITSPHAQQISTPQLSLGPGVASALSNPSVGTGGIVLSSTFSGVTPQQYGAIGDGTTDDTVALSNWMNSGFPLYCKSGSYKITGVINVPLTLGGPSFNYFGSGRSCPIILNPNATVQGAFGATVAINTAGTGYIIDDVLPCIGGTIAANGQACTIHVTALTGQASATPVITSNNLASFTGIVGGVGYSSTNPPGVYLAGGNNCGAKAHATVSGGAVTAISVTFNGAGNCTASMTAYIDPPPTGGIAAAQIWNGGAYSSAPSAPITLGSSQRGTAGSGATVTLTSFGAQSAPAGIKINIPSPNFYTTPKVTIRDMNIAPAQLIGSTPSLEIDAAGVTGGDPLVDIDGLSVTPTTVSASSLECLHLQNIAIGNANNVYCGLSRTYATTPGFKGLSYTGLGNSTTNFNVNNMNVFQSDIAFYYTGTVVQGMRGSNMLCGTCNFGLVLAPSDNNFISGNFTHLDIDATTRAVLVDNAVQVVISDSIMNTHGTPSYGGISACLEFRGRVGASLNNTAHDNQCSTWQAATVSTSTYVTGLLATNVFGSADNMFINFHDNQVFGGGTGLTISNITGVNEHNDWFSAAFSQTMHTGLYAYGGNHGWIGPYQTYGTTYQLYNDANSGLQQPTARINSGTTGNQNAP